MARWKNSKITNNGFTLIEMLVVLAILGILITMMNDALVFIFKAQKKNQSQGKYQLYHCEKTQKCSIKPLACLRLETNNKTTITCSTTEPCVYTNGVWTQSGAECTFGVLTR